MSDLAAMDARRGVDDQPNPLTEEYEPQFELAPGSWTPTSGGFNGSQRTAPNTSAARGKWKFDDLSQFEIASESATQRRTEAPVIGK